jgi:flagellar basal-body rod protein FlgB
LKKKGLVSLTKILISKTPTLKAQRLPTEAREIIPMPLNFTDGITNLLTTYLDVQSRRAQVISGNIANADTPNYIAKKLEFNDYLRDAVRQTLSPAENSTNGQPEQKLSATPQIIEQTPTAVGIDGNTVDVGREMSELAESGMQYLSGTKLLQSRLKTLRAAIREGK